MSFADLFRKAQERDEYWTEDAIISFTDQLHTLMKERGMSQSDLAAQIGVSQPYVAKILKGRDNFTIATMVKLVRAVGGRLQIVVGKASAETVAEPEISVALALDNAAATREREVVAVKKQPEPKEPSRQPYRASRKPVSRRSPDSLRRLP